MTSSSPAMKEVPDSCFLSLVGFKAPLMMHIKTHYSTDHMTCLSPPDCSSLLHMVSEDLAECFFQDGCSVMAACCHLAVDNIKVPLCGRVRVCACVENPALTFPVCPCASSAGHVQPDPGQRAGAGRVCGAGAGRRRPAEHSLLPPAAGQEVHERHHLVGGPSPSAWLRLEEKGSPPRGSRKLWNE